MNLKGTKPKITITVPLQFEIMTNPSMVNYAKVKRTNKSYKNKLTDHMKHNNMKTFLKKHKQNSKVSHILYPFMRENILERFRNIKNLIGQSRIVNADIIIKPEIEIS